MRSFFSIFDTPLWRATVAAPPVSEKLPSQPRRLPATISRAYAAARNTRGTYGFGSSGNTSADEELSSSLTQLRARSRQMVRDSSYAKRAKVVVVNNVIGSGVGMQAQVMSTRGELSEAVNSAIEQEWCDWCCAENCHTGGKLHFHDLERAAKGQVFETGEVIIRKHYAAFGSSRVPLALELIEPERLADGIGQSGAMDPGNEIRLGVEVDGRFGRPVAYWIRQKHPGDIRVQGGGQTDRIERVPAEDIFHLYIIDRWPQTRGEPWLHTAARKLDDMNEYSQAEVTAARTSAMVFGTIKTPQPESPIANDEEDDGTKVMDIEPGMIQELSPGEELDFHNPNRPNVNLDPFMRYMLREVAAGCGPSYESISRDYSQSNYSSSRLALLEDRDLWKVFQLWWIRNFRMPLHKVWLRQAVMARAIQAVPVGAYAADMRRYEAVLFKPRGWSWIDPTKEVNAYKEAIKAGLTTATDVIAQTADGRDIEDVAKTAQREKQLWADHGVVVDTDVAAERAAKAPAQAPAAPPSDGQDGNEDDQSRARRVVAFKRDAG